jgi:hypothetical protein
MRHHAGSRTSEADTWGQDFRGEEQRCPPLSGRAGEVLGEVVGTGENRSLSQASGASLMRAESFRA